ncbi:calcium-translocating P-type ATPase [Gonapodya prolifera JEL478]|uniref:Calcium-transporting ATPase 2 n=1 Tax=Gonapodya prolifera (strain JEL478) TaxID=1344416 RepID=A0A138ZX52_GONPJ|nr:calcium-translocating P-type ATPase [Gonapodya prolifera JEL478]|eukprot:KXS09080.1 calcium-translocating P-type ATPase [Gonapodya prolifera JEL478]
MSTVSPANPTPVITLQLEPDSHSPPHSPRSSPLPPPSPSHTLSPPDDTSDVRTLLSVSDTSRRPISTLTHSQTSDSLSPKANATLSRVPTSATALTADSLIHPSSPIPILRTPSPTPSSGSSPYAFSPAQLQSLFDPRDPLLLAQWGGVEGLAQGLQVDLARGITVNSSVQEFRDPDSPPLVQPTPSLRRNSVTSAKSTRSRPKDKDTELGLSGTNTDSKQDEREGRRLVFGTNVIPKKKSRTLWELMWGAFQDKILILLTIAACISLALGLYSDLRPDRPATPRVGFVEGLAIILAVIIVVLAGSVNDLQKERQFKKLNAKRDDRGVKVVRAGRERIVGVADMVVGDVLCLEPGDVPPTDCVLASGHITCDESSLTGETDTVTKYVLHSGSSVPKKGDPFVLAGSKVVHGVGKAVVCCVGERSVMGSAVKGMAAEQDDTPLQIKLDGLAEQIAKLGGGTALLMLIVLVIKYLVVVAQGGGFGPDCVAVECPSEVLSSLTKILISAVTIIVVAVPEGLPLAVTLALAYGTLRMLRDGCLVRVLSACETMGGATAVCSDKTGTLTENRMSVVRAVVGVHVRWGEGGAGEEDAAKRIIASTTASVSSGVGWNAVPAGGVEVTGEEVVEVLRESVAVNSTAFVGENGEFVGSKTETALLSWAGAFSAPGYHEALRHASYLENVQVYPFSSERKAMATVVKVNVMLHPAIGAKSKGNLYRLYVKGASELVLGTCAHVLHLPPSSAPAGTRRTPAHIAALSPAVRHTVQDAIAGYAEQTLRTIALAYRDVTEDEYTACLRRAKVRVVERRRAEERVRAKEAREGTEEGATPAVPVAEVEVSAADVDDSEVAASEEMLAELRKGSVLVAVVGIEDPLREGVVEAVAACKSAGVTVRMVTGDNIVTAKSIALKCGILDSEDALVMEGSRFRTLRPTEMERLLPRLRVLARSSPMDKQVLVAKLKEMGETVAVTGDGTNDGPALKMADVGFSMGISGTEVAKEASSIVLMDDNFASIVKAIMWGRSINDSVKKFLQFQLTVNITAVTIAFVSAIADGGEESVLTAVQLLWVNLIMDTLAALALATEIPTMELLNRPPENKRMPLIPDASWKMIIGQSVFQIVVSMTLVFAGQKIFRLETLTVAGGMMADPLRAVAPVGYPLQGQDFLDALDDERVTLRTIIFNTFVYMQVVNMLNCRRVDNTKNVFVHIDRNLFLVVILLCVAAVQTLLVFYGGVAFSTTPISGPYWGVCLVISLLGLPLGVGLRCLPDGWFAPWRYWMVWSGRRSGKGKANARSHSASGDESGDVDLAQVDQMLMGIDAAAALNSSALSTPALHRHHAARCPWATATTATTHDPPNRTCPSSKRFVAGTDSTMPGSTRRRDAGVPIRRCSVGRR